MASEMVIPGASFNPLTDMKYTKPKVNSVGGRSVGIVNSKTSTVLNLSSPLMLTWGVNDFTDEKSRKYRRLREENQGGRNHEFQGMVQQTQDDKRRSGCAVDAHSQVPQEQGHS